MVHVTYLIRRAMLRLSLPALIALATLAPTTRPRPALRRHSALDLRPTSSVRAQSRAGPAPT
jgi:hypothetical protein